MKSKSIFIIFLASVGLMTSCDNETIYASGEVTTVEYAFTDYSELNISDAFDAFVLFSDTEEAIRIEANDNLHDDIVVQKSGNSLTIKLRDNTTVKGDATMKAYITTADLNSFDVSGESSITLDNE